MVRIDMDVPKREERDNLEKTLEKYGLKEIQAEDREHWLKRMRLLFKENPRDEILEEKEDISLMFCIWQCFCQDGVSISKY